MTGGAADPFETFAENAMSGDFSLQSRQAHDYILSSISSKRRHL